MSDQRSLSRRLLNGWLIIAARFGHVQTMMFLVLTYIFLIGPIGIGSSLMRRDFLAKRGMWTGDSAWQESESAKPDLERAKRLS